MLIPILIFVLSLAATMQFTIFSWRARLLRVVSASTVESNASAISDLATGDFHGVDLFQQLCPSLDSGDGHRLGAVRFYHKALQLLESSSWAKNEMALCGRYAAAVLNQRMERNQILAAEVCSF